MGWETDEEEECMTCGCMYKEHDLFTEACPDETSDTGYSEFFFFEGEDDQG